MSGYLLDFIAESNRIEDINREPSPTEVLAHRTFLDLERLTVEDIERFVYEITGKLMRDKLGMDVRVGMHFPPKGAPKIRHDLSLLVEHINAGGWGGLTPFQAHVQYETLHPFMDGNGRSGRVIWAWQMRRDGLDPFALPFLHRFYYQALDAGQGRS